MKIEEIKVVDLGKPSPALRVGIAHILIQSESFGINLDNIRRIIIFSSERGVSTIVLPFNAPYGVPLSAKEGDINDFKKKYAISMAHPFMKMLRYLAESYGVNVIAMGVLEKFGHRYYISSYYIGRMGDGGFGIAVRRKAALTLGERLLGVAPGMQMTVFDDGRLKYFAMMGSEVLYPEVARFAVFEGADAILISHHPADLVPKYVDLARLLSMITGRWVIIAGESVVSGDFHQLNIVNTVIINPEGEIVHIHSEPTPALIMIPSNNIKARDIPPHEVEQLYTTLYDLLKLRKIKVSRSRG